jgi:hypothetical protein
VPITHAEVADRTGLAIPAHLVAQAEVPTASNGWRQGDVMVRREEHVPQGTGIPLTEAGHKVVAGDADRNSHILNGDGRFHPGTYRNRTLDYGLLVVPAGGTAVLTHSGEHGSVAFTGGDTGTTWRVWGQASYEQELRRTAD